MLLCTCRLFYFYDNSLGAQPDYDVIQRSFAIPNVKEVYFALILFGIFIGAMGVLYNKSVLILLNLNDYFKTCSAGG